MPVPISPFRLREDFKAPQNHIYVESASTTYFSKKIYFSGKVSISLFRKYSLVVTSVHGAGLKTRQALSLGHCPRFQTS